MSEVQAASALFKALGSPVRLGVVTALDERGALCVHELVQLLGVAQPLVSQHLRVLREVDVVRGTRRGKEIVYELADEHVAFGDGGALRAVGRRGVGKLNIAADVVGRQHASTSVADDGQRAAIARDDGPQLAVRDGGIAVVAPGRDGVADAEPFTCRGQHLLIGLTGRLADLVREGVDPSNLFAGVDDDELADAGFGSE